MVNTQFTLASGSYQNEQDLLDQLDFFLENTIQGWNQVKIVTDTASDKNIVYYTDGSSSISGTYDRMWARVQATNDELRFSAFSNFEVSTDTASDEFGGSGGNTHIPTSTTSGFYRFVGNEDAVHVVITHSSDNTSYHGGFGYFNTYYNAEQDPKPFYVFGQVTNSDTFESVLRLESYGPHSWGKTYSVSASGTSRGYSAAHPILISKGTPNARSGEIKRIEPVFYTDQQFRFYEIRGEVPGLYMSGGTGYSHGNIVTLTGTILSERGDYLMHKYTDDTSWLLGQVTVSGEG